MMRKTEILMMVLLQICEFYDDWTRVWVDDAQVPYKYDGSNWVSYDDAESIGLKVKFKKLFINKEKYFCVL